MALVHSLFDMVDEDAAALQAEFAGDDLAVAVHKKCRGQHADAAIAVGDRVFADQNGVIDAHILGKFGDIVGAGIVHGYTDDLESVGAVFLLQLDKPGHLDLAGPAVSRPEIEQNGLAAQVREFDVLAVERGEFKVGREIADQLSLGRAAVGRGFVRQAHSGKEHGRDERGDEEQDERISFHV